MQTTTTTADNIIAMPTTAPLTALKKAPKQWMLGVSQEDKEEIVEIASLFMGPGVKAPFAMTEKEAVNMLLHVAKNNRYLEEIAMDDDGNEIVNQVDSFEVESKRIFSLRLASTKPAKVDMNNKEALQAEMARIQKRLEELGLK